LASLRQEQRAVAVAEEAEVVGECPVVDDEECQTSGLNY